MLVYVIKKEKLISFTLPSKIYGSYRIEDEDEQGVLQDLIEIKEVNGRWEAFSNKQVKIIENKKAITSIPLREHQFIFVQKKYDPGYTAIYICPQNDSSMKRFDIKNDTEITVGALNTNTIYSTNQLISPQHAQLTYQGKTWLINDLNSQYGTYVNNQVVKNVQRLYHGDVVFIMGLKIIVLGDTLLFNNPENTIRYNDKVLMYPTQVSKLQYVEPSDEDRDVILYNETEFFVRSPRFMEIIEPVNFLMEAPPQMPEQDELPLLLTMGPMITMGATSLSMLLSAFMGMQNGNSNWMSVMPTLVMSFSMLAGTLLWPTLNRSFQKKQKKKKMAKREKKYTQYLANKEKELMKIATEQKQILLTNSLSSEECYNLIASNSRKLWARELQQKDFLALRLGIGKVPLKIKVDYPQERFKLDEDTLEERMRTIVENNKDIDGAPIVASLIEKNILALEGKYHFIKPYMDNLLLQIIALHSYYDLKIVVFTDKKREQYWEYMKNMPHCWSDDKQIRFFATDYEEGKEVSQYLQKIVLGRKNAVEKDNGDRQNLYRNFDTYYLIITDDYKSTKDYPFIEEILEESGNIGFSLMILHPNLANLPTQCKGFIGLNDLVEGIQFENELTSENQKKFTIKNLDKIDMNYCAVKLANIPIESRSENYILPKTIRFLEMNNVGQIEQLNSIDRWKRNNPLISLAAPIGIGTSGKLFKLDLHEKEHGPHGLIAGMTGSGKSEFIITYILSMALNYHPNEVQFVLIDYKGGGLVGAFENKETGIRLPHLAGTITNLDVADINRSLASIESELKRRQHLFNIARDKMGEGTIDIYKYQRYYREGMIDVPISHLFIISDEFAELKAQQPEFMDQLISTARIGRSLGVHLILATQKPSGVVNAQIWSNSRFRVCLKVQDESDSNEMLKRPDAANIKEAGRFYLQVGHNEIFESGQAAWAGGQYIPQDKVYHEVDEKISFVNNVGKDIKSIDRPKAEAKVNLGEELVNIVKYLVGIAEKEQINVQQLWLDKIPNVILIDELKKKYAFQREPFHLQAILGEYDNPKAQKQGLFTLDFASKGNAVIYSMTDKNIAINAIAYSLITTYTTEELNMYILDMDSETLKMYQKAPQIGDVVFGTESEKIDKLIKMLLQEVEERKRLFQDYNGSYEYYCKNSGKTLPSIVFILTGYENFKESYEELEDSIGRLVRDCDKYGVYVITSAISDRSLRLSMRSNFTQIIPLKLSSPIEYNMLLGKKAPTISDIYGRGIVLVDEEPYEFQTAHICDITKINEYVREICSRLSDAITKRAPSIPVLPDEIAFDHLSGYLTNISSVPIGIEEEDLNVATYNFQQGLIHLINCDDEDVLRNFGQLLIHQTSLLQNAKIIVVDFDNYYDSSTFANYNVVYINSEDGFERFDQEQKADNSEKLVYVTGLPTFIKTIKEKIEPEEYFKQLQTQGTCHFAALIRLVDLKPVSYDAWFSQYVRVDSGIWIGRGINNSTIHKITTPMRYLGFPIPDNFGYLIYKGNAIRIKLLEKEEL